MLRRSRPLPGWERVGLADSSLAVWWVCVRECQCLDGDMWGGGAVELGPVLTRAPSGDFSPPPSPRLLQPLTNTQTARRLMAGESLWMWRGAEP